MARKAKQYAALERNAQLQKNLDAVEAEKEQIQAQIDAEQAAERAAREAAAETQKRRMEEHMDRLTSEIDLVRERRNHAVEVLTQTEAAYNQEAALAEAEASQRAEVTTQLKAVYAEVAQLCHISQLEAMRSRPKLSPAATGLSEAREYSRYTGADHDALVHAEAHVTIADATGFDKAFLRDHDAKRGISPEKPERPPLATTGTFLGEPVGPRPPMDASQLLLGPSVLKSRAKRTRKATEGLVKNLMESDPGRYGIPNRFAPKPE